VYLFPMLPGIEFVQDISCPAQKILLDLIILLTFDEEYKL
jgi:hypothetical protein